MDFPGRSALLPVAVSVACLATACSSILGLGDFKDGSADAGSSGAGGGSGGSTQPDAGGGSGGSTQADAGGTGGSTQPDAGGTGGSTQPDAGGAAGSGGGCTSNTDCQASSSGPICNKSSGSCVQCVNAGDCTADAGSAGCCGSKCVDLAGDTHNCGACGHDCLGGTCSAGKCQPVLLGKTTDIVSDLALDGGYLYWGIFDSGASAAVERMPVAGGTAQTVTQANYADGLAFDSTNIYFVTSNSATSTEVPLVGKASKASLPSSQTLYNSTTGIPMAGLVLAGSRLYWVRALAAGGSVIESVGTDGSGATVVVGNYNPSPYDHRPLVTDGKYLYWFEYTGPVRAIDRYPIVNGTGTAQTVVSNNVYGDLALSGSYVYFIQKTSGLFYVANASTSGTGQNGTLLSSGESKILDFVVDGSTVIWSGGTNGTVKSVTIGSSKPTTLAAGANAQLVAVDAKAVYWWAGGWKFYRLAR